ncbi:MAG: glycerol kinase, partial [Chloroflexi bacterium]|nr:glycerol kinase [Chloroflexota bacterium]
MSARTKKLINNPGSLVPDMLAGFGAAYHDIVRLTDDGLIVRRTPKVEDKVALVI